MNVKKEVFENDLDDGMEEIINHLASEQRSAPIAISLISREGKLWLILFISSEIQIFIDWYINFVHEIPKFKKWFMLFSLINSVLSIININEWFIKSCSINNCDKG